MERCEIINLVLKYFNFQQLCIAERISMNFQRFVLSELRCLTYIDFGAIFTSRNSSFCELIFEKIFNHCVNIRKEDNIQYFSIHLESYYQLQLLHSIQSKLTNLEVKSFRDSPMTLDGQLGLIEKLHSLQQLTIKLWIEEEEKHLTDERLGRIQNLLLGQQSLKKLVINCSNYFWIDLRPSLTDLDIRLFGNWYIQRREQLLDVLACSPNLKVLKLACLLPDEALVTTILQLKHLEVINLDLQLARSYGSNNDDINWCEHHKAPMLDNLEEIVIFCRGMKNDCNFVSLLLSHCPRLRRCRLNGINECSHDFIFSSILQPDMMECFQISPASLSFKTFLNRMPNLKHYHMNRIVEPGNMQIALPEMQNLEYLSLNYGYPSYMRKNEDLEILISSHLQALYLSFSIRHASCIDDAAIIMDLILAKCPNLRYFSSGYFPVNRIMQLPSKLPNLEFLEVQLTSHEDISIPEPFLSEQIARMIENLPKLRVVIVSEGLYEMLLEFDTIVQLCRQGRLLVRSAASLNDDLWNKWLRICSSSCCA